MQTTLSSLQRESDELRAVHHDQREKLQECRQQIDAHAAVGENRYQEMELARQSLNKQGDQVIRLMREIKTKECETVQTQ